MEWETVTTDEARILECFYDLLKEVSCDWAYAIGESPREWVICIYKQDGVWKEYMIEDGMRVDFNTNEKDVYDLCLNALDSVGGNDHTKSPYLMRAFEQEVGALEIRRKNTKMM